MDATLASEGTGEIDLVVGLYLDRARGDAHAALRAAVTDALRDAVEARLTILELQRAASLGYLRQPPIPQPDERARRGGCRAG